ncbi:MAG: hypothetical protein ABS36_01525 [Acidobacteria bacterium SCN 69-37]|nr:MAG: hypothetical protein ABS36_01525 [Acidobacteria bacterium SCN 69-37]
MTRGTDRGRGSGRGWRRAAWLAAWLGLAASQAVACVGDATQAPMQTPPAPVADDAAGVVTGRVVTVDDGDTMRVRVGREKWRVRLFGVDAPEASQPYGREARDAARRLLLDRTVEVVRHDVDQYGRVVADLRVDGRGAGADLVAAGAAWQYDQFSRDAHIARLEAEARAARRGLWAASDPTPPWQFRAAARGAGRAGAPAAAGPFHGNTASHVFHAAGCEDYECNRCTAVFETVAAARAAGYRPHATCVR